MQDLTDRLAFFEKHLTQMELRRKRLNRSFLLEKNIKLAKDYSLSQEEFDNTLKRELSQKLSESFDEDLQKALSESKEEGSRRSRSDFDSGSLRQSLTDDMKYSRQDSEMTEEEYKFFEPRMDENEFFENVWTSLVNDLVCFQMQVVETMRKINEHIIERLRIVFKKGIETALIVERMFVTYRRMLRYHEILLQKSMYIVDSAYTVDQKTGFMLEWWEEHDLIEEDGTYFAVTDMYSDFAFAMDGGVNELIRLRGIYEGVDLVLEISEELINLPLRDMFVLPLFQVSQYTSIYEGMDSRIDPLIEPLFSRQNEILEITSKALEKQRAKEKLRELQEQMNSKRSDKFQVNLFTGNEDRMCIRVCDVTLYKRKMTSLKKKRHCTLIVCNDSLVIADLKGGMMGINYHFLMRGMVLLNVPDHGSMKNAFRVFPEVKKFGGLTLVVSDPYEKADLMSLIESYIQDAE